MMIEIFDHALSLFQFSRAFQAIILQQQQSIPNGPTRVIFSNVLYVCIFVHTDTVQSTNTMRIAPSCRR